MVTIRRELNFRQPKLKAVIRICTKGKKMQTFPLDLLDIRALSMHTIYKYKEVESRWKIEPKVEIRTHPSFWMTNEKKRKKRKHFGIIFVVRPRNICSLSSRSDVYVDEAYAHFKTT